jgi:hypothetical protein
VWQVGLNQRARDGDGQLGLSLAKATVKANILPAEGGHKHRLLLAVCYLLITIFCTVPIYLPDRQYTTHDIKLFMFLWLISLTMYCTTASQLLFTVYRSIYRISRSTHNSTFDNLATKTNDQILSLVDSASFLEIYK